MFFRKRDRDLEEEIASHLRMAAQDSGPDAARREFGNIGLIKEVTREMWGWKSAETLLRDLQYGLRILRKNPGYTLTAVLSLALGIGANTAIFSLIDSIMLQSLPVHNPEELVSLGDPTAVGHLQAGGGGNVRDFSFPFYRRFRAQNNVFSGIFASGRSERLSVNDSDEHPRARFVSDNYFQVLGVSAWRGRTFSGIEPSAIVISYDYWDRAFQRAPDAIGRTLRLNGAPFTIIGVTPRDFFGEVVGYQSDLWLPIEAQPQANPGRNYLESNYFSWLMLMGRLKPGVSLAQATAVTNTVGLSIRQELAVASAKPGSAKTPNNEKIAVQTAARGFSRIRRSFSKPLWLLMILVGLVLLICCTNVANLQLARATSRSREMGLRLAIGASRVRLLRQLMTESLVLALLGAAAGLFLAHWIGHFLLRLVASQGRAPIVFHLSGTALLFTAALALAAGLLFGLAPSLYATKSSVANSLKTSKSGTQRLEKSLVVFQIVLSWVLLFGSGLFIRTLQNLESANIGYQRDHLFVADLDIVAAGYTDAKLNPITRRLLDKLSNTPGVNKATVSENGLFSGTESSADVLVEGFTPLTDADKSANADRVGPGYFETLGTPIVVGRGIGPQDNESTPRVAAINESMARFYFGNHNPIGRHFSSDHGKTWTTIVGIVQDAKQRDLREPAARRFYTAYFQHENDDPIDSMRLEVRTQLPAETIRRVIKSVDATLPVQNISPMQTLIEDDLQQERLIAKLSGAFSVLALLLASVGLYGVMSYLTQRRTVEVGIRMALGASSGSVVKMVLREALTITSAGLAVGITAAFFLFKLVANSLYGVEAFDPLTLTGASCVIFTAAILAAWIPARRAAKVDPMVALRAD
jgi:predicted permease